MTRPYYVADRRERDMVDWREPGGVEVVEHSGIEERVAFWLEWDLLGGWDHARRPTGTGPAL